MNTPLNWASAITGLASIYFGFAWDMGWLFFPLAALNFLFIFLDLD